MFKDLISCLVFPNLNCSKNQNIRSSFAICDRKYLEEKENVFQSIVQRDKSAFGQRYKIKNSLDL